MSLRSFVKAGHKFKRIGNQPKDFPLPIRKWLLDKQVLQELAGKGLRERAALLQQKFDFKVCIATLRKFFIANRVTFTKPQRIYRKAENLRTLLRYKRQVFAVQLCQVLSSGEDIIYVDETTFNTW